MHRCMCIWRYILQNYNYKLHFLNLSIYHIPHVCSGTLAAENLDVCTACGPWDSNIQLTMVKDRRRLLPPHLDLHLEVFIPKKKKEIAENITVDSENLKTQNLRTSGSAVSPNPHQRTSGFHDRPGSFPGSYSTCSKQREHPQPYTHGLFDHHDYISYQNRIFAFLIVMVINVMPGEGLVWFLIPAPLWLPPIGNGGSPYWPRRLL